MNFPRWFVAFAAVSVCAAQSFPLRPGDWEVKATAEGQPVLQRFCLNDETWKKALMQNSICKLQALSVTAKGIHYEMECNSSAFQMKGPIDMTFDGMEHMVAKASLTVTSQGKTTTSQAVTDYRWKAAACSSADVNLKPKTGK